MLTAGDRQRVGICNLPINSELFSIKSLLFLVLVFLRQSHVVQTDFKLITFRRTNLNSWSSCVHLPSSGMRACTSTPCSYEKLSFESRVGTGLSFPAPGRKAVFPTDYFALGNCHTSLPTSVPLKTKQNKNKLFLYVCFETVSLCNSLTVLELAL